MTTAGFEFKQRSDVLNLAMVAALLPCGCVMPPPESGDEYQAEMFASTRELSDATLAELLVMTPDGTLCFSGTPDQLSDVSENNVLLAGVTDQTPTGFIRMVTGVQQSSEGLVLQTVPAPIQFAFRKLNVQFTRSLPDVGQELSAQPAEPRVAAKPRQRAAVVGTSLPLDFFVFNGDDDPDTEDDQVRVTGQLTAGIDYTFGINVDWGEVFDIPEELAECAKSLFTSCTVEDLMPEAKVGFSLIGGVNADLNLKGVSFLPYARTIEIDQRVYEPIKIGPLWFFPVLDVCAEVEGAASSEFALSSAIDLSAGTEVAYSNKSGPSVIPPHFDGFTITAPTVDATLDAYTKVRLGPRLALKLYQIAGPYAGLYGYVRLDADALEEPCWTLSGGVEGELGFVIQADIPFFGTVTVANWNEPLSIWNATADSGSCSGSSTQALTQFQQPTFTPWARAYASSVITVGLPYSGPGGGVVQSDLRRAIDGHYLLCGSGADALLKLDANGDVLWARRFTGPTLGDPFIDALVPDRATHAGDAGSFVSAYPWALLKLDASGTPQWARQFPFSPDRDWWRVSDVVADDAGGFYLIASYGTNPIEPLDVDALLGRFDADANPLWLHRLGDAQKGEVPRALVPFDDGVIVLGSTWDLQQPGRWRPWAIRLGSDGALVWQKEYPTRDCTTMFEQSVQPHTGHQAADGDLILGGTIDGAPQRSLFAKIRPDGALAFITAYRAVHSLNLEDFALTSLVPLPTSGYLAAGVYLPYPYDLEPDLWVGQLDGLGQIQWAWRLKSPDASSELLPAVQYTTDGGLLAAGYTETLANGGLGFAALKAHAKDGALTFSAASNINAAALGLALDTFCASTSDWSPTVVPLTVELVPIDVVAHDVTPGTAALAP